MLPLLACRRAGAADGAAGRPDRLSFGRPPPLPAYVHCRRRPFRREVAAADPVHHRQRGLRALQLLRDAQHPDTVPGVDVAAGRARGGARGPGQGRLPQLRHRRVLLPAAGRVAVGSVLRQVQHRALVLADLLRGPRAAGRLRRRPARLLRRVVPDRARIRRDQAARGVVRRRPVRPVQQGTRQGRLRRVLLVDQLRQLLRVAADADLPSRVRARGGLRHSRDPDGDRDAGLLARPDAIRPGPSDPRPGSALLLPCRRHGAVRPRRGQGPARAGPGGLWRHAGGGAARVLGAEAGVLAGAVRVRDHLLSRARRAHRLRRRRDRAAARTRPRRTIRTRRSTT